MANYICTSSEITSLADAIRTKGGTSASLTWPNGFISAVNAISAGGDTSNEDAIIQRTISSSYDNSRISLTGNYAFAYCSALTTVNLPLCNTIGSGTFLRCNNLTTVSIPKCASINDSGFWSCTSLSVVNFSSCSRIGS